MNLQEKWYYRMFNRFDVEVFCKVYYLDNNLTKYRYIKLLISLNKFYPSNTYKDGSIDTELFDTDKMKLEDVVNEIPLDFDSYLELNFNIPVFAQIEGVRQNSLLGCYLLLGN